MGVFSWLGEQIKKITAKLKEWIEAAVNWIVQKLEDVRFWIANAKRVVAKWFSKVYNTTWGFWAIIAIAVATLIIAPEVAAWLTGTAAYEWVLAVIAAIKAKLGESELMALLDIGAFLNRLFQILIPEYKEMWQGIYDGLGALSHEIGLGIGAIENVVNSGHMFMKALYTIIGADLEGSELAWWGAVSEWLKTLEDRFERYFRNPHLIWEDFITEVIIPSQEAISEAQAANLGKINAALLKLNEVDNGLDDLQAAMLQMAESLPEATLAKSMEMLKPVNEFIDGVQETIIDPIEEKVSAIVEITQKRIDRTIAHAAAVEGLDIQSYLIFYNSLLFGNLRATRFREILARFANLELSREATEIEDLTLLKLLEGIGFPDSEIIDDEIPDPVKIDSARIDMTAIPSNSNTWYQGEY